MKTLTRNILRTAITVILVILAFVAIFRAWVYYTASPWTRDARFSADIVAIAPDVSGLISQVNVKDNQLVKKDQVLFVIDQPRYQKALAQAEADVAYYQTLAQEKRVEAGRRNKLSSKEANSLLSIFIEAFQDQWILILLAALGLKIIFNFVGMIFPAIGEDRKSVV